MNGFMAKAEKFFYSLKILSNANPKKEYNHKKSLKD